MHRGRTHRGEQRGPGAHREHARAQEQAARLAGERPERDERVAPRDLGEEHRRVARGFDVAHDPSELLPGQRVAEREPRSARLSTRHHAWHRPTHGTGAFRDGGRRVARGGDPAPRDAAGRLGRDLPRASPSRREQGPSDPVGAAQRPRFTGVRRPRLQLPGDDAQRRHLRGGSRRDQGRRCRHRPGARGGRGTHPRVRVVVRGQRRAARGPDRRSGGCARAHRAAARAGRRRDPPDARTVRAPGVHAPHPAARGRGGRLLPPAAAGGAGADDAEGRGRHRAGHRPLPVAPREGGRGDGRCVRGSDPALGGRSAGARAAGPDAPARRCASRRTGRTGT